MLMAVLDVIESPAMREQVEECGGINRPDGVRPPLWRVRFDLNHATPATNDWLNELEHAVVHVVAAGDAARLQAALRTVAAISASWALALEIRTQGEDS
jgi:hypothetical protein